MEQKKIDALYVKLRTTTQKQEDNTTAVEKQKRKLLRCAMGYHRRPKFFVEENGGNAVFERLLEEVKLKKIRSITVINFDLISRDVRELTTIIEFLNRYDVSLRSVEGKINTSSRDGEVKALYRRAFD